MSKLSDFYKTEDERQNSKNVCFGFCSFRLRKTEKTANTSVINHRYIPKISCKVNSFSLKIGI